MQVIAIAVSVVASLFMLVLLVASAPNSSPQQWLQIRIMMAAVALVGLGGPAVSIWAMSSGRNALALWAGITPTIFVAALFIVLMNVEL